MLRIHHSLRGLDFGALMEIYKEGNSENAAEFYPDADPNAGVLRVEQDFYQYLNEIFFPTKDAVCAVLEYEGTPVSALRLEPYRDGLLLEALETHPDHRRKGHAKALILLVLEYLRQNGTVSVYAHVNKKNELSLRTHISCGFYRISEHAVYIDGSVNSRCCTLEYRF